MLGLYEAANVVTRLSACVTVIFDI